MGTGDLFIFLGIMFLALFVGISVMLICERITTLENTIKSILKKERNKERMEQGLPVDMSSCLSDYDVIKLD